MSLFYEISRKPRSASLPTTTDGPMPFQVRVTGGFKRFGKPRIYCVISDHQIM
jgi:hypothetical protein